jgi:hypothetical protein
MFFGKTKFVRLPNSVCENLTSSFKASMKVQSQYLAVEAESLGEIIYGSKFENSLDTQATCSRIREAIDDMRVVLNELQSCVETLRADDMLAAIFDGKEPE